MSKTLFTKYTCIALLFALASCNDNDVYQGEKKNKPLNPSEVFGFDLTKQIKLNVDYNFTNDYYILFQLYDQNPVIEQEDTWIKNEELSPIYSASTDPKGQYSGTITIPADITEVWLYSDYPGAASPVRLTVSSNNEIRFDQKEYIASLQASTRGTTSNGYEYLDDWMTLPQVSWDKYGLPSSIEPEVSLPPADVLYSIKKTYSKVQKESISALHPEWLNNNTTSEIRITKDTELSLVFISSGANWNNSVGYYTYPTGTEPTENTIQKVLAFPNVSPITKTSNEQRTGALLCGHEVKLKYWNADKRQFEDKFPAGISVGWCLQGMGFKDGNIVKGQGTRYSYSSMNKGNTQCVVALRHSETDQIVAIGFEDNMGYDYCDAVFYLKIAEQGAIDTDSTVLPPVNPPSNEENAITYKGTLTFEDQWPSQGDYDMNDVVVEYQSTLYRHVMNNNVYKIVNEFTPVHSGGSHICGFGYQLHNIGQDRVRNIQITGPEGWQIETEQSHPTITLFDNLKNVLKQKYTVTMELADVEENKVKPPYNPFIYANSRSTEVHLVNYPPTEKADMELFNTKNDVSNPQEGVYYISLYEEKVKLMPFGINIPTLDFKIPAEGEGEKIYDTYPGFIEWVISAGKKNVNWYK